MTLKSWTVAGALLLLAGCGDSSPVVDPKAGPVIRTIDLVAQTANCEAGEEVLGAYCYAKQGEAQASSGVSFRMDSAGAISASCLAGGNQIRLFCLKR